MNAFTDAPPLSRFSLLFDALLRAVGYHAIHRYTPWGNIRPIAPPMLDLVLRRLYRTRRLFLALAARYRAGTLRRFAHRRPSTRPRAPRAAPAHALPRRFGWLCNFVPGEASIRANHLRILLAEPEMQELLAATPRAAKILAPVCRMIGIEPELITRVGRISEAQSAIATLPQAGLSDPAPPPGHSTPGHSTPGHSTPGHPPPGASPPGHPQPPEPPSGFPPGLKRLVPI